MNYVESLNLFGIEAKEIPCIKGSGAPTESTVGAVGLLYMDTNTGDMYKCTAVGNGVYVWKALVEGDPIVEPAEDDIPKVFIDGVIPTTKDDVLAEMRYVSKTDSFHAYLKIKCQGSSSMSYGKKNFTIKMYYDEARDDKFKKSFKDWNYATNKYVLKANYIDHTHARNIVCANLWNEVVASRPDYNSLPVELRSSPRNGAIDGFPIKVYTNGTYQGIYTWNVGKDDWMWGMDEDNANHVLLCGELNTDGAYAENACNFRALWSGINEDNWSVEVGTNSEAVKNSLNALISCVKDTDGGTFKSTISNYLDVQSAIDYWIHQYIICGLDGLAKNLLLATYDGTKWICGAYDMDATFGLWWDGTRFVSKDYRCPEDYQERFSLLWERIASLFSEEIKTRYTELRKTVYSYANMVTKFERFMDIVGKELYAEDLEVYTGIPSGSTNNIKQIRNYIRNRLAYCDIQITPPDGALYPFDNGHYEWTVGDAEQPNVTLDVANGNHVLVQANGIMSTDMLVNISEPTKNTADIRSANNLRQGETRFTVRTGDEVKLVVNVEDPDRLPWCLYFANPTEHIFILRDFEGSTTQTFTMERDMEVSNIGYYLYLWGGEATHSIRASFSMELYVNGVKYIGQQIDNC